MFFPVCLDTGAESVSAQDRLAREWRYKTTLFLREFAGSAFAATTIAPEPAFNQWAIQLRNAFAASCASLVLFALSRRRSTFAALSSICSRIKAAASRVERTKLPRRPG